MALSVSTEAVKPPDRVDYWHRVVRDQFKVDCQIETDAAFEFRQAMSVRQIGPLAIMQLEAMPFRAVRQAWSEDCLVTVVIPLEGRSTLKLDKTEVPLEVGSFCAYHSCKLVYLAYHSPCRHLIATVPAIHLADRCPEWECDIVLTLSTREGMGGMLAELVQSLAQHEECLSETCRQASLALTLSLLVSAVREHNDRPDNTATRIQSYHKERIRSFALSRLHDPELSVPQIAAAVGLSLRYMHRLFADEPLRLMQWIYEQRLMRCHRELADPDRLGRAISEIAYGWGFNSAAHFCRAFQNRFGATPSEIRARTKASLGTFGK